MIQKINSYLINHKNNILVYLGLLVFGIFFHYKYLNLPIFWDETLLYFEALEKLLADGLNAHYLKPSFIFHGHPSGMHLFYFFIFKIIGLTIFKMRFVVLLFSTGYLFLTYLISKRLLGIKSALFVTLLLFFEQLNFVLYTKFLPESFQSFWMLLYSYFLLTNKKSKYTFGIGLFTGLIRETSILLVPISLINQIRNKDYSIKSSLASFSSLIGLLCFYLLEIKHRGTIFSHKAFQDKEFDVNLTWSLYSTKFSWLFNNDYLKTIILLTIITGLTYLVINTFNNLKVKKTAKPFNEILTIAFYLSPFSIMFILFMHYRGVLPRYFVITYPYMFILFMFFVHKLPLKKITHNLIPLVLISFAVFTTFKPYDNEGFEYTLEQNKVMKFNKTIASWMSDNLDSKASIVSPWPYHQYFSKISFGYTKISFNVEDLQFFKKEKLKKTKYFILDSYMVPKKESKIWAIINNNPSIKLIKSFVYRDLEIEIFENTGFQN